MYLRHVGKSFQHEQVYAAFEQRLGLLAKDGLSLLGRRRPVRLYADAERPYGPGDERAVAGGFARQPRARAVDLVYLICQPVARELGAVSAVRVRLDDVRARLDVIAVDVQDEVGVC